MKKKEKNQCTLKYTAQHLKGRATLERVSKLLMSPQSPPRRHTPSSLSATRSTYVLLGYILQFISQHRHQDSGKTWLFLLS